MGQRRYRVYFTPISDIDMKLYGSEIDVSDRIEIGGIGTITRTLDSTDYNIGLFTFSDVTLKGYNYNGYFNDETDFRSIFRVSRDLCKVRIEFEDIDVTRDSASRVTGTSTTNSIIFNGIINEEATRVDAVSDQITFKALSRESVFRTTRVPAGVVSGGMTIKQAIESILNDPKITSVLNFSAGNINPDLNITIDSGSVFDNTQVNEALNQLLLASNSILFVNGSGDIIVRNRDEDTTTSILNLYGKSDELGRENIVRVTAYNLGRHRCFTSFKLATVEVNDTAAVDTFGFRQKTVDAEFITDNDKRRQVVRNLLAEFKTPRVEVAVEVPKSVAANVELLDRVSINYPLRVKPIEGKFLPVVGVAVIGDTDTPLPNAFGSISIPNVFGFKVIEIAENPRDFTSILKLRQINNLVFNAPGNCIVGFAKVNEGIICDGGTPCDAFLVGNIGSAKVGCTVLQ